MKLLGSLLLGLVGLGGSVALVGLYLWAKAWDTGEPLSPLVLLVGIALIIGCFLSAFRLFQSWREDRKEPIQPPQTTTGSSAPDRV